MKILVCGDRNWSSYSTILATLREYPVTIIVQGECRGADLLGKRAGQELKCEIKSYPADWATHGRAAGPIRNTAMLKEKPDLVLAFHSNIDQSRGTKNMILQAKKSKILTRIIKECVS